MPTTTQGINWTHAEATELEIRVCPTCGITYACPGRFIQQRRDQGGSWFCPNGHTLSFTKTIATELREKLAAEKRNVEWWRERKAAADAALTKAKKRAANGVCPCCSRSFANVRRHMETQHPGFNPEAE